jgi:hypothetical protein
MKRLTIARMATALLPVASAAGSKPYGIWQKAAAPSALSLSPMERKS